jgi:glycosyltransferase involved in cell wall biosynthesis
VIELLCRAPLDWRAGGEYALLALWRARRAGADCGLTFVGDGEDRERLLFTINDLGLDQVARLLPSDGPAGYQAFLLAAVRDEAWPGLDRAIADGLPVVASDLPGIRRRLTPDVDSLLVPARDAGALAGALVRLSREPRLRERLAAGARGRRPRARSPR